MGCYPPGLHSSLLGPEMCDWPRGGKRRTGPSPPKEEETQESPCSNLKASRQSQKGTPSSARAKGFLGAMTLEWHLDGWVGFRWVTRRSDSPNRIPSLCSSLTINVSPNSSTGIESLLFGLPSPSGVFRGSPGHDYHAQHKLLTTHSRHHSITSLGTTCHLPAPPPPTPAFCLECPLLPFIASQVLPASSLP